MTCYYPDLPEISWKNNYFFLGLTGAIGSGKSTAATAFKDAGAIVFDADQIAKTVLHSRKMRPQLITLFGNSIFHSNEQINTSAIAQKVFSDPGLRQQLNHLIHPEVQAQIRENLQNAIPEQIYVYDVPLLFESDQTASFDLTLVISAPLEIRLKRIKIRNNWSEQEFHNRESTQMPLLEKEKRADLVINNSGTAEALELAIKTVYQKILSRKGVI